MERACIAALSAGYLALADWTGFKLDIASLLPLAHPSPRGLGMEQRIRNRG
jgi:hypothetical protein